MMEFDDALTPIGVQTPNGRIEARIDLIAANREINRLSDKHRGKTDFSWTDEFLEWFHGHTGIRVGLALADKIADWCVTELESVKKARMLALAEPAPQPAPTAK